MPRALHFVVALGYGESSPRALEEPAKPRESEPKAETPEIKVVPAPPAPEPPAPAAPAAPEPKEKEKKPLGLRSIFDSLLAWLAFSAFSVDASQDRFRTCGTPASRILCCEGEQGQCEPAELVALGLRAAPKSAGGREAGRRTGRFSGRLLCCLASVAETALESATRPPVCRGF